MVHHAGLRRGGLGAVPAVVQRGVFPVSFPEMFRHPRGSLHPLMTNVAEAGVIALHVPQEWVDGSYNLSLIAPSKPAGYRCGGLDRMSRFLVIIERVFGRVGGFAILAGVVTSPMLHVVMYVVRGLALLEFKVATLFRAASLVVFMRLYQVFL